MILTEAGPLIGNIISKLPTLYRGANSDSIIDFSRPARNEFLTLIEDDLVALPYIGDVAQSALTLTSCYFLSSLSLLMDIPELQVLRKLDQINAKRDPVESLLGSGASAYKFFGTENHDGSDVGVEHWFGDPMNSIAGLEASHTHQYGSKAQIDDKSLNFSGHGVKNYQGGSSDQSTQFQKGSGQYNGDMVSMVDGSTKNSNNRSNTTVNNQNQSKNTTIVNEASKAPSTVGASFGRDTAVTLKELANLSVGKQFEVVFEKDGNKQPVQLSVRLMVTNTDRGSIKSIIATGSMNNNMKERIIRARAGQLGWFKDLILCNDLVDEARKTRIKDKSGFYEHMMRKRSKNFLSGLLSMAPSINNASAVIIMSGETAKAAALELGGELTQFSIRQKVFEVTQTMLMFVVDTQWETVTIFHRGIDRYNELRVSELKRANGKSDGNVEDILRAYSAFTNPTL